MEGNAGEYLPEAGATRPRADAFGGWWFTAQGGHWAAGCPLLPGPRRIGSSQLTVQFGVSLAQSLLS